MKTLRDDIKLYRKGQKTSVPLNKLAAQVTDLHAKHYARKEYDQKMDGYISGIRLRHEINKLHPEDILIDEFDNILDKAPSYLPWQSIPQALKDNGALPSELRKALNRHAPEKQNMKNPVLNEEDSQTTKY